MPKSNIQVRGGFVTETISSPEMTIKIEYSSGNPIYIGMTEIGNATGDAKWQIKKITYDVDGNPTDIQWADGTAEFVKVWDNRATYSYS